MEEYTNRSPLTLIDTSFENYVRRREASSDKHTINGVPDYAFALDNELRQKLMQIPHLYSLGKKLTATYTARQIQLINQQGIAVSPSHFPDIYQMGVDCAHRLGIGVPNIYIINDPTLNAYTVAADMTSPLIVLHSGIVERLTPGELKAIIAHECGHVHNDHLVLKQIVNHILNIGANAFVNLGLIISAANIMLMTFWTRAGEITCDRASLLCCDDPQDVYNSEFKFLFGAMLNRETKMDVEALRGQLEEIFNSPTRILELGEFSFNGTQIGTSLMDHPGTLRRIFAEMEFAECETLYDWRPDLKKPGTIIRTKEETDERCRKLVNILDNK